MNTRVYKWAALLVIIWILGSQTQLLSVLFAFIVLGIIPGTNLIMPSWIVFIVYPLLIMAALIWLSVQPLFIGETVSSTVRKTPVTQKPRVPVKSRKKATSTTKKRVRIAT